MTANEKVNEVLVRLIRQVELRYNDAEKKQADPDNKHLEDFYKGELSAYDVVWGLLQDQLIDDDNL